MRPCRIGAPCRVAPEARSAPGGAKWMECRARSARHRAFSPSFEWRAVETPTRGHPHHRNLAFFLGSDLVDWIGQVPRSGEKPSSGERFPPSSHAQSIKLRARTAVKPALQRGRHSHGEWFEKGRLEQRWEPGHNALWGGGRLSLPSGSAAMPGQAGSVVVRPSGATPWHARISAASTLRSLACVSQISSAAILLIRPSMS